MSVINETDAIANLSGISFVSIDFSMFDSDKQNGMTALTVVEWKNSFSLETNESERDYSELYDDVSAIAA